ncbi:MAG: hypothetical protein OEL88_08910, partial [Sterolibacteriaceae bacterium MAG5]|nr:hypothetical protein [Candidatus Nitricoxidireducens bremensis]
FITFAQGNAGLKFTPTGGGDGSFTAQASTSNADGGLGGSTINATIAVGTAVASPTINEDTDSGAIAISQGGAETHYKITGITGGTLYSDAGYTTQINDGDFIACAGATTNVYFRPTAERNTTTGGNGSFVVQASSSSADGGLFGAQITSTITLTPVADTPSVASPTIDEDADSGAIAITRSAVDGAETTHYQITGITGGTLYSDAGYTTQINNGDFIASGGATTNVYFRPTANRNSTTGGDGAFTVQASKSGVVGGLAGATATSTITLTPVADTPSVASPTIDEDADSGAIAITRAAGDGAETTHYQITGITGGTLYSDAGYTTQINNGDFIASAGATTNVYFRPTANRNSTTGGDGAFTVQASKSNVVGGLAGSTATSTITLTPVADTPSVASPTIDEDTDSGAIAITRSAVDGAETTHYQITGITGGTLYSDAGYTTQINNGDFIASGGATTNVYFRPTANRNSTTGGDGAFTVQASKSNVVGGLAGSTATSTITLTPVADTPSVASPTIDEDADSGAIAITRAAGDGAETTHYQITGITGGTLYSDAGYTTQINNGDFIASGGATTNVYFRPTANRNSTTGGDGAFTVQASKSNVVGGLAGSTATSTITLTPVADTPSVTDANTTPATQTTSGLVLSRSAVDGAEVTHFKITGITNGNLFLADGTTAVNDGDFITFAQGNAGLKFTPTGGGDGSFTAQASTSNADGGLGGSTINATIAVGVAIDSPTIDEDTDSGAIAITQGGAETHYKITGITGGTLYSDAGFTTQINDGDFIAVSGGPTTSVYFRPTANRNTTTGGNGSFVVQASSSNADGGLFGSQSTSTITLTPVADTPSVTDASTTAATQTSSGLVLSRNAADGAEVTHFKITGITNGSLFQADGVTAINDGDFITYAEGNAGLKFTPTGDDDGAFTAQASTSNADGGLGGATVTANIDIVAATTTPPAPTPLPPAPTPLPPSTSPEPLSSPLQVFLSPSGSGSMVPTGSTGTGSPSVNPQPAGSFGAPVAPTSLNGISGDRQFLQPNSLSSPTPLGSLLVSTVPEQMVTLSGSRLSFALPADAFVSSNPGEKLVLSATQADGRPLPGWMKFDAAQGTFEGEPPPGVKGEIVIKIKARDSADREANVVIRVQMGTRTPDRGALNDLDLNPDQLADGKAANPGRASFSEQVRLASRQPLPRRTV